MRFKNINLIYLSFNYMFYFLSENTMAMALPNDWLKPIHDFAPGEDNLRKKILKLIIVYLMMNGKNTPERPRGSLRD